MGKKSKIIHKKPQLPNDAHFLKKLWFFIWYDDSPMSWIVNIILAFIIIKFLIYPLLGFMFGTSLPVVAVISGSMEHNGGFDNWLTQNANCATSACTQEEWYLENGISKDDFVKFPLHNGFNKGDIIFLKGVDSRNVKEGDVIVYTSKKAYPIIHRVIHIEDDAGQIKFVTKGDNNAQPIVDGKLNELGVLENNLIGKAFFKIPYVGYIKIWFSDFLGLFGMNQAS